MVNLLKPLFIPRSADLYGQIKWLVLARSVFAIVLIFSTLFFTRQDMAHTLVQPFLSLYHVATVVLVLSIVYMLWLNRKSYLKGLAYFQTIGDTCLVTAIIFVTGGYGSIFTFLYLVVIIYTAMLLLRQGAFVIATLSSLQYGLLIELEYYQVISPMVQGMPISQSLDESQVIYRIVILIAACFAVAFLSGILSLQLRMARRDLRITQEHLKRVEKMATVDEMISGIAHEIKNPLASLSGSIQMLRDETQPGTDADRLMQIILRETERLKLIVNDIRLISKPGTGNTQVINIAKAIEDVVTLFLNTPDWKSRIELYTRLEADLFVEMDPGHLQQILWNLVKNAAEAIADKGKIIISLSSPRNNRIYLSIRDTGKGIPVKQSKQIFDPFFTTKSEGTGLGLHIIHRIIDTYEGMIDFESIPEKGTIFTVVLKNANPQSQ